jgi:hypothetical protein
VIFGAVEARAIVFNTLCDISLSQTCYWGQAYAELKSVADVTLGSGGQIRSSASSPFTLNETGLLSAPCTNLNFNAIHQPRGLGLAGARASLGVSNSGNFGAYNVIASGGTRSQVRFLGYGPTTPGRVDFNFNVSGNRSTPWGYAFPRLDFLVRPYSITDSGLIDIFLDPRAFNTFVEGSYTYSYTGSIADPLDVLFWSGAGILIGINDPLNHPFPTPGTSFSSQADCLSTFELESIALFDQNGDPINEWSLGEWSVADDAAGAELFNSQLGRLPSAPAVPGPLPLLGVSIALGWSRRLRRRLHIR